ncbi:MAG TPA: hypothetical protein VF881_10965 [Polyangiaceae bacterium]
MSDPENRSDVEPRSKPSRRDSYAETLVWLRDHAMPVSIVCYGAGYLILAVHLGSLGATALEALRTRHIVTGLLFLVFVTCVVVPLRSFVEDVAFRGLTFRGTMGTLGHVGLQASLGLIAVYALLSSITALTRSAALQALEHIAWPDWRATMSEVWRNAKFVALADLALFLIPLGLTGLTMWLLPKLIKVQPAHRQVVFAEAKSFLQRSVLPIAAFTMLVLLFGLKRGAAPAAESTNNAMIGWFRFGCAALFCYAIIASLDFHGGEFS